ncbi:MAG: 23S rRNA (uracil(1939)-C(5))-methyltransferase RlmD [bacterium]
METIHMETIHIDSLAYGGYGVGRINSRVVFVNYAVPGDTLKIEIFGGRKSYAFGRIVEIITPSPKRITPVCKHFGICGGCNYLNMPYEEEIYWKTEIFKTEFKKNLGNTPDIRSVIAGEAAIAGEAYPSHRNIALISDFENGNYLNYRQKIGLKIYPPYIGFYKKLSHNVVDIGYCYLAKASVNELLKNVRNLLLSKNYKDTVLNKLAAVTLTDAGLKNIIFKFKNNIKNNILKNFTEDVANNTGADNVFFEFPAQKIIKYNNAKNNNDYFILKDKKFSYDLPSFIQINKEQNENIISIITDYIKNIIKNRGGIKFNNALDLYCGFGNITLFLESYANRITGVEAEGFSIKLGEKNIELNKIKNIKFIKSNVEDFLEKANRENAEYDLVVLDPPRAGIKGLAPKAAKLKPSLVIYVSCDAATFLRDLKVFAEEGYEVNQINLVDMFPRTYHMEHIAFLKGII